MNYSVKTIILFSFLRVNSHERRENLVGGWGLALTFIIPQDHEKWREILVGSKNGKNPQEIKFYLIAVENAIFTIFYV